MKAGTTKIFFNCGFTALHQKSTLVYIALISECGKKFYAEVSNYNRSEVKSWAKKKVLPKLKFRSTYHNPWTPISHFREFDGSMEFCGIESEMRSKLEEWLSEFEQVEMWSDCLAYNWVLFNNIFGNARDAPKNVYHIPFDICALFKIKGIDPDISREVFLAQSIGLHFREEERQDSLFDVRLIKICHDQLIKLIKF